jgi:hypothetical protein
LTRVDFYPGFAKTKAFYEKEFPPNSKKPWPYDESVAERAYNEWLKIVVDPSTEEFYKGPNDEDPKYTISQIVRIKTLEGTEHLYSIGQVKGYNMYHDPIIADINAPETYLRPEFVHETQRDERDGHNKRFTTGISDNIKKYELDWNAENIDKLLAKKSPRGCMLTVREENSGQVKECRDIEMFKTASINYILNDEWQTPEQREVVLKEEELFSGKKKR